MIQWLLEFKLNTNYLVMSLLAFSLIMLLVLFRRLSDRHRVLQNHLFNLQNEVRAINSGNLGMGRKINQFAEDIANVEMNKTAQVLPMTNEKSYQQAGLLLSRGATIEEVVESCDIAPAEAELLAVMRHSSPSKTAA